VEKLAKLVFPQKILYSKIVAKRSIFYKNQLFYIIGLKLLLRNNFNKRYRYMASFVNGGDSLLEPGCGPAILADYLPKGTFYSGFDTNKAFIEYGRKKKFDIYLGNVLEAKNYKKADFVVACDVLHHLKPGDRKIFIRYCFASATKKLIICDSYRKHDFLKPVSNWFFEFFEKDGTNQPKYNEYFTKEQLRKEMENGFEVIVKYPVFQDRCLRLFA
jgi:hypothetical protein